MKNNNPRTWNRCLPWWLRRDVSISYLNAWFKFGSVLNSSFLLKDGLCHLHGRPRWSPEVLALTWPSLVIAYIGRIKLQMDHFSVLQIISKNNYKKTIIKYL